MRQIDLDDLPPRIAEALCGLQAGETVALVRGGLLVAQLAAVAAGPPDAARPDPAPEVRMAEVLEQFNAMIHDEF